MNIPKSVAAMERSELRDAYDQATRNLSSEQLDSIRRDPRDDPADTEHVRYVKTLYRRDAELSGVSYERHGIAFRV